MNHVFQLYLRISKDQGGIFASRRRNSRIQIVGKGRSNDCLVALRCDSREERVVWSNKEVKGVGSRAPSKGTGTLFF